MDPPMNPKETGGDTYKNSTESPAKATDIIHLSQISSVHYLLKNVTIGAIACSRIFLVMMPCEKAIVIDAPLFQNKRFAFMNQKQTTHAFSIFKSV